MADTIEPPRKRRRPALSCFECRARKIKCDRNYPCGQCTQSKNLTCTYSKDAAATSAAAANHQESVGPSFSIASDTHLDQAGKPPASRASHGFVSHLETPSSLLRAAQYAGTPQLTGQPSRDHPASKGADADAERTIENLTYRVQKLEQTLADSIHRPQAALNHVPTTQASVEPLRGILHKNRFFGQSSSKTVFEQFGKLRSYVQVKKTSEVHGVILKCKSLAGAAKVRRPDPWTIYPELKSPVPSREVADQLLHVYLRTFESAYRILHIPSFQYEYKLYWDNPEAANPGFVVKLLLVMAIGTCLYDNPENETDLRSRALHWIYAAQSWLSAPFEKSRLNLTGLQVHCLLLLARQTSSAGSDLVWISAGALLRTAMQMGLHHDPSHFPKMSILQSEIRRRLWSTIMEIAVQSSLDAGMPPLISFEDFDTGSPSNINDDEIDESTKSSPRSETNTVFTQTSLQITLLKSLRTRLEVARLINDGRVEPSYDDVLRLSTELVNAFRESTAFLQAYQSSIAVQTPTTFHRNLLEHFLRRFLLVLHRPFAFKARTDPRFYFSRKVCLESSMTILSPEADTDFSRLMVTGGGLASEIFASGAFFLCLELITQLEEDGSNMVLQRNKASREPMREAVRKMISLSEKRVQIGGNNFKGHVFLSMAMGQIDAMEAGTSPEQGISDAAKKSVEYCHDLLKARIPVAPTSSRPVDQDSQELGGEKPSNVEDLGFDYLQDANFDFEIPDSWLFPAGYENSWT